METYQLLAPLSFIIISLMVGAILSSPEKDEQHDPLYCRAFRLRYHCRTSRPNRDPK